MQQYEVNQQLIQNLLSWVSYGSIFLTLPFNTKTFIACNCTTN